MHGIYLIALHNRVDLVLQVIEGGKEGGGGIFYRKRKCSASDIYNKRQLIDGLLGEMDESFKWEADAAVKKEI
jgi:hypothetical protein